MDGVIVPQDGIVNFYSEERNIVVPLSVHINADQYDQEVTAYIRDYDGELLLELGEDDVLWSDMTKQHYPISNESDVVRLSKKLDDSKENSMTSILSQMGMFVGTVVVAVLMYFLFMKPIVTWVLVGASALILANVFRMLHKTRDRKIIDESGNWIDIIDGTTSLNGGTFRWLMPDEYYGESDNIETPV